jgi:hypothetical protein
MTAARPKLLSARLALVSSALYPKMVVSEHTRMAPPVSCTAASMGSPEAPASTS